MVLSRFAGKKKAIIFLILPLILISFIILLLVVTENINFLNLIEYKFIKKLPVTGIQELLVTDTPELLAIGIPGFIVYISSLIYGLHPTFIRTEKFFSKRGYINVVLEYEFIKKLLFVIIILLAIVLIILYSNLFYQNNTLTNNTFNIFDILREKPSLNSSLIVFSSILGYIAIAAILRITTQNLKREFRFYFAKASCKIISGKNDKVEKMKYLFFYYLLIINIYKEI